MINTINTASTGLEAFSKGLSVISENVANLNTAGFKQQRISYFDLGDGNPDNASTKTGDGVETGTPYRQFNQGEIRKSDNDIDAAIDGSGFFVVKDTNDSIRLTRAGQFQLNSDGILELRETGEHVQGLVGGTKLADITIADKRTNPAKATATISFTGALNSNGGPNNKISNAEVYDAAGNKHVLVMDFVLDGQADGTYNVTISENNTPILADRIRYNSSGPDANFSKISFPYTPTNSNTTQNLILDFSKTTSASGGAGITIEKQDGYAAGGLTKLAFDEAGLLKATYSNGQTADLAQLALANTFQLERLQAVGKNQFAITNLTDLKYEKPQTGGLGKIKGGSLEASNVELTAQFSELIITQRAYQASSQVITTTNEMLAVLFELKGRR